MSSISTLGSIMTRVTPLTLVVIPGKIMYYDFEGGTATDRWNAYHGTNVNGNAITTARPKYGTYSATGNGTVSTSGSGYTLVSFPAATIVAANGLSFSFYFYKVANSSGDGFVFQSGNITLWMSGNTSSFTFGGFAGPNTFTMTTGQWLHVVCTVASDGTCNVYVNNAQVITNVAAAGYALTATLASGIILGVPVGNGGRCINGSIDDFKIYNTVLSAAQRNALYANTAA